jgi:hypothetical protein
VLLALEAFGFAALSVLGWLLVPVSESAPVLPPGSEPMVINIGGCPSGSKAFESGAGTEMRNAMRIGVISISISSTYNPS